MGFLKSSSSTRCRYAGCFALGFVVASLILAAMFWIIWCYMGLTIVQISDSQRRGLVNYSYTTAKTPTTSSPANRTEVDGTLQSSLNAISKGPVTPPSPPRRNDPSTDLAKGDFAARTQGSTSHSQNATRRESTSSSATSSSEERKASILHKGEEDGLHPRRISSSNTENRAPEESLPEIKPTQTYAPAQSDPLPTDPKDERRPISKDSDRKDEDQSSRPRYRDPEFERDPPARRYDTERRRYGEKDDDDDRGSPSRYDKRDRGRETDDLYSKGDKRVYPDERPRSDDRYPPRDTERRRGDDRDPDDRYRDYDRYLDRGDRYRPREDDRYGDDKYKSRDDQYRDRGRYPPSNERHTDNDDDDRPYDDRPRERPYDDRPKDRPYDDRSRERPYADRSRERPYDDTPRERPYDDRLRERPYDDRPRVRPYDDRPRERPYDDRSRDPVYEDRSRDPGYEDRSRDPPYDDRPRDRPYDERREDEDRSTRSRDRDNRDPIVSSRADSPPGRESRRPATARRPSDYDIRDRPGTEFITPFDRYPNRGDESKYDGSERVYPTRSREEAYPSRETVPLSRSRDDDLYSRDKERSKYYDDLDRRVDESKPINPSSVRDSGSTRGDYRTRYPGDKNLDDVPIERRSPSDYNNPSDRTKDYNGRDRSPSADSGAGYRTDGEYPRGTRTGDYDANKNRPRGDYDGDRPRDPYRHDRPLVEDRPPRRFPPEHEEPRRRYDTDVGLRKESYPQDRRDDNRPSERRPERRPPVKDRRYDEELPSRRYDDPFDDRPVDRPPVDGRRHWDDKYPKDDRRYKDDYSNPEDSSRNSEKREPFSGSSTSPRDVREKRRPNDDSRNKEEGPINVKDVIETALKHADTPNQNSREVIYPNFDPRLNLTRSGDIPPANWRGTTIMSRKRRSSNY